MLRSTKGSYAQIEGTGSKTYQDQRRMQAFLGLAKKLEDTQSYRFNYIILSIELFYQIIS